MNMNYTLVKDVLDLIEKFEIENLHADAYSQQVDGFKKWIIDNSSNEIDQEPNWEGKENGRSPESVINTLIVHMNRYAKSYSKSAIHGSAFATQEDFIYLINLKAFGNMKKMELIKKNVHEKPVGMQIINRLIKQGWVKQTDSETDKRSKLLDITEKGLMALEQQMNRIRQASTLVTGDLNHNEKMELIRILNKLDRFHQIIYDKNIEAEHLIAETLKSKRSY